MGPFSGGTGPDTAAALMHQTLLDRQTSLRDQLAAAIAGQRQPAIRLFFDGRPVRGQTVTAAFLGKAIDELQSSIQALGSALAGGLGSRGLHRERYVEETQLLVTG